jgi:hypothetical protein
MRVIKVNALNRVYGTKMELKMARYFSLLGIHG